MNAQQEHKNIPAPAWPGPFDIEVDCIAVRKDPSE